jgi:hypothetical protein
MMAFHCCGVTADAVLPVPGNQVFAPGLPANLLPYTIRPTRNDLLHATKPIFKPEKSNPW